MGISESFRSKKKFSFIIDKLISELKDNCNDEDNPKLCAIINDIDHIKVGDASLGKHKKFILLYTIYYKSKNKYEDFSKIDYIINSTINDKYSIPVETHYSWMSVQDI